MIVKVHGEALRCFIPLSWRQVLPTSSKITVHYSGTIPQKKELYHAKPATPAHPRRLGPFVPPSLATDLPKKGSHGAPLNNMLEYEAFFSLRIVPPEQSSIRVPEFAQRRLVDAILAFQAERVSCFGGEMEVILDKPEGVA